MWLCRKVDIQTKGNNSPSNNIYSLSNTQRGDSDKNDAKNTCTLKTQPTKKKENNKVQFKFKAIS